MSLTGRSKLAAARSIQWRPVFVARAKSSGTAWRGASRPAMVVLVAARLHARRVEAARWFGEAVPVAVELAGERTRGGELAVLRGEREGCQRGIGGVQEEPERLGGAPMAARAVGGRGKQRRQGGGTIPAKREVEEGAPGTKVEIVKISGASL